MPEFWDEQMVGLASTRLNQKPVLCDWCAVQLPAFNAVKVMCSTDDPWDYLWACETCWEVKRFG